MEMSTMSEMKATIQTAHHGLTILELKSISMDERVKQLVDKDADNVTEHLNWVFSASNTPNDPLRSRLKVFLAIHSSLFEAVTEDVDEDPQEAEDKARLFQDLAIYFEDLFRGNANA